MTHKELTFREHVIEIEKLSRKEILHDMRLMGITAHRVNDHAQLARLYVKSLRALWKSNGWVEVK